MSLPIAINARYSRRRVTGVERFASEIVRRLESVKRNIVPGSAAEGFRGHLWEQLTLPGLIAEDELLWSPANTGPIRIHRQVVTIHDISPIDHPEWFQPSFRLLYNALLPRLVRTTEKITTDSQFSKDRILKAFELPEQKVAVVPGGVDAEFFKPATDRDCEATRIRYGIPGEYILALGTQEPRKNIANLIKAWELSGLAGEGIELVIAGSNLTSVHANTYSPASLTGVRFLGYVPDVYLPSLYTGAKVYVFPSLYEGFGLPALEAMACGTAVITSNAGALEELVGDAAIQIDPNDTGQMAEKIRELVTSPETRQSLQKAGESLVEIFTWEKAAAAMDKLFASLA